MPERPTAAVEYWCDVIARRPLINTNSSAQFAGPFYVRFHKQNLNAQSVATFARVNERKLKLFNCSGDFSLSLSCCAFAFASLSLWSCVNFFSANNRSNSTTICRITAQNPDLMLFYWFIMVCNLACVSSGFFYYIFLLQALSMFFSNYSIQYLQNSRNLQCKFFLKR